MKTKIQDNLQSERIIGFDLLRVIMLLMLFVFHAGVSFMETTLHPEIWLYKNQNTNLVFDGLLGFIHALRHPTFFIISGFVTEMMYRKYTANKVLKKRIQRLFVPFLITAVLFGPLVYSLFALLYGQSNIFSLEVMFPPTETSSFSFGTSYIWFVYYLVIYNLIHYRYKKTVSTINSTNKIPSAIRLVNTILINCLLVIVILYIWKENTLFGEYSFFPALGSLGGYFIFYMAGIFLFNFSQDLQKITQFAWPLFLIGSTLIGFYFYLGSQALEQGKSTFNFDPAQMLTSTISSVFICYGALGLAIKYYLKPIKLISYIAKSSYFLYLIHFPFVLVFLILIANAELNVFLKFAVVLIGTLVSAFCLNFLWIKAWKNNPPI